jgi:CubicO group peptidase (beta-lactamase class C family)
MPLYIRSRVPRSLDSVTSIGTEVAPRQLGLADDAADAIWAPAQRVYASGVHPSLQLCVRRHGQVLVNRAIGHSHGNGPDDARSAKKQLCSTKTPCNIFSASKPMTAMVMHLLDQRGVLHVNDRVCDYIPEFARRGKEHITIKHVLTHRAGLPSMPPGRMDLDRLEHPEEIIEEMCAQRPATRPGRMLAYHAISGGFLLAEVVRRATGHDIRQVMRREICKPLGFRWTNFGVAARDAARVARSYVTGVPLVPPLSTFLTRALGVSLEEAVEMSNDKRFLTAIIPSANVVTTAEELSRFYQLLLNDGTLDGVKIFEPRTVRRATAEQSYLEADLTLGLPLRYSMGFMLGARYFSLYGPDTDRAFGHLGLTNIIAWADPERQVSAALITSGKGIVHAALWDILTITRQIAESCPRIGRR